MPRYADGFVIPVPKKNIDAYRRMSRKASRVWMDHGALEYCECVGEEMKQKCGTPFPTLVKPKRGETIVFAWIVYKSSAHRDRVNKKVMSDPRMNKIVDPNAMPFDIERMTFGGFEMIVDVTKK